MLVFLSFFQVISTEESEESKARILSYFSQTISHINRALLLSRCKLSVLCVFVGFLLYSVAHKYKRNGHWITSTTELYSTETSSHYYWPAIFCNHFKVKFPKILYNEVEESSLIKIKYILVARDCLTAALISKFVIFHKTIHQSLVHSWNQYVDSSKFVFATILIEIISCLLASKRVEGIIVAVFALIICGFRVKIKFLLLSWLW